MTGAYPGRHAALVLVDGVCEHAMDLAAASSRASSRLVQAAKHLVTEMVCWAAGGPQQYSGRSMEDTHRDLMISEAEWQAFMDDFR